MLDKLNLEGKKIVVTGGGTGLGREMALAMAKSGADVVLGGRRHELIEETALLIEKMSRRSLPITTDVTDSSQVNRFFDIAISEFGAIDVLVNNAGMIKDQGGVPIWEILDDEWRAVIDANLTGAFYCSRAVAKHMVERAKGKIINVSSVYGLRGGRDNFMYACAKGGIIQLTRSLATSMGRYGVTSNCIVPGFFHTEGTTLSRDIMPNPKFIPVGRAGDPKELGPVAVFLASSASDYMNGELFAIDGGALAGGYAPTGYVPNQLD